jgi:membrane protein DedA with SNARE-associated domain
MAAFAPAWRLFTEHAYVVVFLATLIDATGTPFPGRLLLIAAGAAAAAGTLSLPLLIGLATIAAVLGDHVWYVAGRLGRHRLLRLYCRLSLSSRRCVQDAERYIDRFGPLAIVLGRFVAGVRLFASPLAGTGAISYPRFLGFEIVGALLWSSAFLGLGYLLGDPWGSVTAQWNGAGLAIGALLVVTAAATVTIRLWRRRRYGPSRFSRGWAGRLRRAGHRSPA